MFETLICKLKSTKKLIKVSDDSKVFTILLIIRILSVFLIQTHYTADEYWQSLEIAHNLIFGYGYLTWEWILSIRSYIHPLIFAVFYQIFYIFNCDTASLLVSCISCIIDLYNFLNKNHL